MSNPAAIRPDAWGGRRWRRGVVRSVTDDGHHGFLIDDTDQFHYFDRRHLLGTTPAPTTIVWFVSRPPLIEGRNPVADPVLELGAMVSCVVTDLDGTGSGFASVLHRTPTPSVPLHEATGLDLGVQFIGRVSGADDTPHVRPARPSAA